jgi:biotin carboxylase
MNNKSCVCLIGSGPWQRDLFNLLLVLRYPICSIAPENNFHEAQYFIRSDVRDIALISEQIEVLGVKPLVFISSQTDLTVNSVAKLNAQYNISDKRLEAAELFTNKFLMRRAVDVINGEVLNPKYRLLHPENIEEQIQSFDDDLMSNVVIKPTSLQSSLGVKYINNVYNFDFHEYLNYIRNYNVEEFIVEKRVDGTEYTIEGYKHTDGTHELLAASEKSKIFGFGIANALHYSNEALEKCRLIQDDLNKLFSCYDFGPTHTEIILNDDGKFYLVEAAVRGGGSGIPSHIVPALTGFYPEKQLLVDSGLVGVYKHENSQYDFVSLIFFEFRHSAASPINTDNVQSNIIRLWSDYKLGEKVREILDDRSRHGFVIVGSTSADELRSVLDVLNRDNPGIRLHV